MIIMMTIIIYDYSYDKKKKKKKKKNSSTVTVTKYLAIFGQRKRCVITRVAAYVSTFDGILGDIVTSAPSQFRSVITADLVQNEHNDYY